MDVSEDSWREVEQLRGRGELFVDGLVLQFAFQFCREDQSVSKHV